MSSTSTGGSKLESMSRRRFFQWVGAASAAFAAHELWPSFAQGRARMRMSGQASGQAPDPLYFIHVTFEGGWDQLLSLDPRDNTLYQDAGGVIYPAYHLQAPNNPDFNSLLSANPSGLIKPSGSNITFGPAVGRLGEGTLYQDLCVLRGVNMGTLTHEVGRRYFLTGKFPRGLAANGSALASELAHQVGDFTLIPNLAVGTETYNEGLESWASGLVVQGYPDLQTVLTPLGTALPAETAAAVELYLQHTGPRCEYELLNHQGQVSQYLASRVKAVNMVAENVGSLFAFTTTPSTPEMQALYEAFHISGSNNQINTLLAGAPGRAMLAAQALTNGVAQGVAIKLADGIDHHDDTYLTDHFAAIKAGFDALADLIVYLQQTIHPQTGKSYWQHTALLVSSDFARTPNLNARSGRDHHLSASCLVAGPGIRGNQVIGATDERNFEGQGVELSTGAVVGSNGVVLRPPDIQATLLEGLGLSWSHLSNQSPQLIGAMLKG